MIKHSKKLPHIVFIIAIVFHLHQVAVATDYVWTGGGDGASWNDAGNWEPTTGYPNGTSDQVRFTNGTASVTLPADLTLGDLTMGTNYFGTNSLAGNLYLVKTGGGNGSLTLDGGMLFTGKDVISGISAEGHIVVGTNGTLVVRRSSISGEGYGQVIAAQSMLVTGVVHGDGEGFDVSKGPAPGGGYLSQAGSHGGVGGYNNFATYGSFTNPVSLGSGGNSTPGGGAVILDIEETLTVTGRLSFNGGDTSGGAGAGGAINLRVQRLEGDGLLRANGGDSTTRHGGGGGRISLANVAEIAFSGSIQVHGGFSSAADNVLYLMHGLAGTVAFPENYDLVLGGVGQMKALRLGRDDHHDYYFRDVVIRDGGLLELDGNSKLNNGLGGPAIIYAQTIDVYQGGQISADGRGFKIGTGYQGNKGSTYGGRGGNDNRAPSYGCFTNPVVFGTGGGGADRTGGGVVMLHATETLQIDGIVSCDALDNSLHCGSGGSINLIASQLRGQGTLRANGGTSSGRAGGGGGRISLVQVADIAFTGTIEVLGGGYNGGYHPRPFSGTIAFPAGYDLTLGGAGNMQSLTLGSDDDHDYNFGAIVINDGGALQIDGNPMRNDFYSGAAAVKALSVDVRQGGTISAFGLGLGMARAAPSNYVHTAGGPHGGGGGGNPLTYGSVTHPINLGSGGNNGSGGGGGLIFQVATTCNVDGTMTASAPNAISFGGGAGGTVNIIAQQLSGSGEIVANAGSGTRHGGGGGRIALQAMESSFDGLLSALGGSGSANVLYGGHGAAGTIYTDLNGETRSVRVDNDKVHEAKPTYTWLPAVTNAVAVSELDQVTLEVSNSGRVALTNDLTIGDLYLRGEIPSLFLNGWTLTVMTPHHYDWGNEGLVDYAGGEILWPLTGTIIVVK